jgi:predicted Fe-S protein YdhL (DUF1289 family)
MTTTTDTPRSPCIKVCVLDQQNLCVGCLRTLDEIAGWDAMSQDEQIAVLGRVERRVAERSAT